MATREQQESPSDGQDAEQRLQAARQAERPSVGLDLSGFLTELQEWVDAVKAGKWDVASERLRDACDEAYCLEGWKEFTNRLGTPNMQHHVHNLRRFLVAVETTARALSEAGEDETRRG